MAQCHAHSKSGARCKQPAIAGGSVCRYHGGSAPQVRSKAALRLASLVDPAIAKLAKVLTSKAKVDGITLRAILDVLDRNNLRGDNLIRLQNPDAGGGAQMVGLSDEQLAVIETLKPDELEIFLRVLGLIATGPVQAPGQSLLTH